MLRNVVLASLIAVILVAGATQPVQAQAGDIQAQIQSLLQRLTELTRQLNALRGQSQGETATGFGTSVALPAPALAHRLCALSLRQFALGSQGDDVRAFQEFLQSEGFFSVAPTGYFGPVTKDALARWQAAQGFESAGVVGPKTLERIRGKCGLGNNNSGRLSASPTSGNAPLTVTFSHYVGGFRPAGISYTLSYGDGTQERATECSAPADVCTGPGTNTHTYRNDGTYTATLTRVTDPCFGQTACRAAIQSEVIGKVQIRVGTGTGVCTKEYRPVCGSKPIVCITTPCNPIPTTYSNRCMMESDGASLLYEGACRVGTNNPANDPQCKAWYDGCNSCARETPNGPAACTLKYCAAPGAAYCTAYFDTSSNRPPTISGLSGPTTLSVSQTGTWIINASDPENQTLTYNISWGDELHNATPAVAYAHDSFVQTTSFTHAYSRAGTYTITVVVRDSGGKEATMTTTVRVTGSNTVCADIYQPVCGRPVGCANTCPPGQYCTAICQLHNPQTYSNRCYLDAVSAQYLHEGQCTSSSGNIY
ncbi:MAG TPA: peptidoglycan-binding protein [Candidatus Paceibacterota bacterium]|nr:peptidoglycan-binding protein [Candidatus Paceibacterota bacterium]